MTIESSVSSSLSEGTLQVALRPQQIEILQRLQRFNVLLAHRRMGKTVLAIWLLILKALSCPHPNPLCYYVAPTYSQAKKISFDYLLSFTAPLNPQVNQSELRVDIGPARISLGSAENPDSNRGIYADYVVLDEPSLMSPAIWTEVLRPAVSDRQGGALFIGTPKGRHGVYYDAYQAAPNLPDWWRGCYKASETGVLPQEELDAARATMSQAEYDQEYECDWSAAIRGAVWGDQMKEIENAGQITQVPWDETRSVWICLDLGINDATAAWFFQMEGGMDRYIDYAEYTNMGLPDIVKDWEARPYRIAGVIAPPDVKVRSLSTGKSRQDTLKRLGVDVTICPDVPVNDGIEVARSHIRNCWFDAVKCRAGIEALRQYRFDFDDKHGVLRKVPIHDWASHGADSFRYRCVTKVGDYRKWGAAPDYSRIDSQFNYG